MRRSATQPPAENSIAPGLKKAQTDNIFKPKWVDGHCLYPQSVKAYNLPWIVLQEWLVNKFPQHKEYHETQREQQDYYFFYIELEKLTEEHHKEINALREKDPELVIYQLERGRHSPDPVR